MRMRRSGVDLATSAGRSTRAPESAGRPCPFGAPSGLLIAFAAVVAWTAGGVGAGVIERVSIGSDASQANGNSTGFAISGDGRVVVFGSLASNLAPLAPGVTHSFVHRRDSGVTRPVVNAPSVNSMLSVDGRFVAFESVRSLLPGTTGPSSIRDVFVRDLHSGRIERASVGSSGKPGNRNSRLPALSGDGRFVAFYSTASNLVSGDTNNVEDLFVRDRGARSTRRLSIGVGGAQGDSASTSIGRPALSADGRVVAFESGASNLVAGDTNGAIDVFVFDYAEAGLERVSRSSASLQGNRASHSPTISANGRWVAFSSRASNLVAGDTNDQSDIFVRDRMSGTTTRVSVASNGDQGDGASYQPAISGDGRLVAFCSSGSNLVPGDTNGAADLFVHDLRTRTTTRISVDRTGAEAHPGGCKDPALSADGRFVAFNSSASNLVFGDTNASVDSFVVALIEVCDGLDNNGDGRIDEGFAQGCDHASADSDGDALPDQWELFGYDADGDGVIDVDLPRMGANPLRKDVFVEVDYMEQTSGGNPHSDQFSLASFERVQSAYLRAPVWNLDRTRGISLHIDAGPDSVMNPRTGETWGALSRSNSVGHALDSTVGTAICAADPNVNPAYCAQDEGATAHRDAARSRIFHYALAAHNLQGQWDNLCSPPVLARYNGTAEAPGRYFVVTQGAEEGALVDLGGFVPGVRDVVQEAGLFMHELGHNMGLGHGGPETRSGVANTSYWENRKPHYFSVMNYSFSYRGLRIGGQYGHQDYNRFNLMALDENNLLESQGLGSGAPSTHSTIRYCSANLTTSLNCVQDPSALIVEEPDAAAAMDWNCSGSIDAASGSADINLENTSWSSHLLTSVDDWSNLVYDGGGALGACAGGRAATAPRIPEEPNDRQLKRLFPRPEAVAVAGQGVKVRSPGHSEVLQFAVFNSGEKADRYDIRALSSGALADLSKVPESIVVGPGAVAIVEVPVSVSAKAARGLRDEVRLQAVSRSNPLMAAVGRTTLLVSDLFPVAAAGEDRAVTEKSVRLSGAGSKSPSGSPLTYVWTGPFPEGGGLAYGAHVTVTLPTIGSHEITLVVNDGVVDSKPATIRVTRTE